MPVAVSRPDAFERAFPPRELSREVALRSMLWSSAAAVVMCCLLLVLAVGLDLLVHQGSLNLAVSEVEQAAELSGLELTAGPNRDLGLFPTVWRVRERFVGDISARMFRQFSFLRTNQGALVAVTLAAFLLGLLRLLAHSRGSSLASRAAVNTVTRLRRQLHRQALRLVPGDLTDRSGAAAIALFTDDIAKLQEGISLRTVRLGRYPVLIALLVLLALLIDWNLALLCLIPLFACWYVLQRQQRRYDAVLARSAARADSELRMLGEGLRKTRLVRGYGMEEFEHAQFQQHLERFRVSSGQVENSQRVARASARCLVMAVVAVAVFLIGVRVLAGREELPVAAGGLLLAVIGCLWHPLEALARLKADRSPASLAADRIFHYLDRIPEVGQAVGAKFLEPLSREITFENVVCELPDRRRVLD
ncbi:MAG: ABC transporter ATP-binding protein, partial [Planctomycetaceae bacterium]|nr:ABC transporter ATP-binding protein [Planctomycetaceae bacterium]